MITQSDTSVADRVFLLPEDVLFVPVDELIDSVRAKLENSDGHLAVTRPGFRVPARLVDEATASLLGEFKEPSTIAEAVLRFSSQRGLDPASMLDEAFPMLQVFSASQILVPEDSPQAKGIPVSLASGQVLAGLEIIAPVQCTLDTEVFRARTESGEIVALKIEQEHAPSGTSDAFLREEDALAQLKGHFAPAIIASGSHQGRRFLAVSWIDGVPITTRAAEIRQGACSGWRQRLARLSSRVATRFSELHGLGIVHGDVHGRNVLVDQDDEVHLIDFGMSRQEGRGAPFEHVARVGFGCFLDPDAARALKDGRLAPPADQISERFALAAFIYQILTGESHLELAPETSQVYEQILRDPPLPFTRHGFESWPAFEKILRKELSKDPLDRHSTSGALARALEEAQPPAVEELNADFQVRAGDVVGRFVPAPGQVPPPYPMLFNRAPIAASDQGAGGYAWFLYRLAQLREQPELLCHADIWCQRAILAASAKQEEAFHTPPSDLDTFEIDPCSLLHREPGLHFVQALICQARGDRRGLLDASEAFLAGSAAKSRVADVTLGRAGTLLAASTLVGATSSATRLSTTHLGGAVKAGFSELSSLLDSPAPPGLIDSQPFSFAHGWVGILYALLRAASVLGRFHPDDLPPSILKRLNELASSIEPLAQSPGSTDQEDWIPGWCNGTAGVIPLFLLAHRLYGKDEFRVIAEWAAGHTASHADRQGHLCCGLAGRVFALLHMYRETGHGRWLDAARKLGRDLLDPQIPEQDLPRACDPNQIAKNSHSLFWGPLGCALALEELRVPEQAVMPLFGDLEWLRS